MDVLSAAASGLAVVSVAFQLAEGCKQLYSFWESVKDAPEEVALIAHDLMALYVVLEYIDRSGANSRDLHGTNDDSSGLGRLLPDVLPNKIPFTFPDHHRHRTTYKRQRQRRPEGVAHST